MPGRIVTGWKRKTESHCWCLFMLLETLFNTLHARISLQCYKKKRDVNPSNTSWRSQVICLRHHRELQFETNRLSLKPSLSTSVSGVGKLWPVGQVQITACICNEHFIGRHLNSFIYLLPELLLGGGARRSVTWNITVVAPLNDFL